MPQIISLLRSKYIQTIRVVGFKQFDTATEEGRSKERYRRIALTSIGAIISRGIATATSLITVPLTLNYLGAERYGLWMTISSTVAFLSFADLGLGLGLLNAVGDASGRADQKSMRAYISSTFFSLSFISVLLLSCFFVAYPFIHWPIVFNISSPLAIKEAGPAVAVLVISIVLNFPLGVIQRFQMGIQEGYKNNLWTTVGGLLGFSMILVTIYFKAGLPWLVTSMSIGPIIATIINWILTFGHSYPQLKPSLGAFDFSICRKLANTGLIFLSLQVLALIGHASDNLLISQIIGPSSVAIYAVTQKLFTITQVSQYFIEPLWPAFSEAMARNDRAWARKTLNHALFLNFILGLLTTIPLLLFGRIIIKHWVGPAYVPSFFMLIGFSLNVFLAGFGGCMATFLNSGNLVGKQLWYITLATVVVITLKIILTSHWGIAGVIWASVLGFGLIIPLPSLRLAYDSLRIK